jgi:hypothetical protein
VTVDQQGRLTAASSGAEIADSDIASSAGIAQSKISGLTSDLAAINASVAIKEAAITAGTAGQYWSGNKTWQTLNTTAVPEGTNQYFTNTRAISALSSSAPINYSVVTGEISITQASGTANGYLSSADWAAFNGKQAALGFTPVNKAGDTITGSLNMGGNDLLATGNIQLSAARTLGLGVYASDPTGLTASDKGKTWFNSTANQIKFWDGSAALALGVAGSGLGSLNGQSGNTQAFATPGSAGTAPSWSSNANAHTLNIPMASAVGVTAGLVSNSDHVAFSNKVSNVAQGVGIAVTTGSGTATVSLSMTGTAGSYAKITTDAYGRVTSGTTLTADDIPPLNASAISTGILPVANGGTGAATLATGNVLLGNGTNAVQSVAPGTSGNVLTSNGSTWQSLALPATNWAAPGTIGSTTPNTGAFTSLTAGETRLTELASNGTNYVGFKAPDVLGANKVWVLPANDGTAGQLLKTDGAGNLGWASDGGGTVTNVTATAPISVSNNSTTPAISISQANGTTNGYLTYTDWNTFNSKQAAGNYVTALTGDVTTSGFSAGSATATLASVSLAGTSTKVTYDVKGRVNSGTTLDATDLPPHSAALITSGTLAVANGGTGLSTTPSAGQILIGNGTGYSLSTLTAGTGINISNAAGAVTVSSTVDTSTKVSKQGDTMTGALSLPANGLVAGTSQLVLAGGNVGIGTTLPSSALTVQASANKGITLRQNTVADRFQMFVGDGTSGTVADDDYIRNLNTTLHIQTGSSGTTEAMTIGVDGNVGIGKLTPTNALDINGSLTLSNNQGIFWRNAAGVQNQVLRTDSGNNIYTGDIFGNFNGLYAIRTSGLDRLTVLPNGNVGIGITNPGAKLHLLNDVTDTNSSGDLYAYSLLRSTSNGTIYATSSEFVSEPIIASGLTNGGDIYGTVTRGWRTSASDTGTLVGLYGSWIGYGHLGTTNRSTHNAVGVNIQPYAEGGSITNSFGLIIQAPSTGGTITNNYGIYQASASAKNYFGGNVGIGTTAPAAKFTVYGAESTQSGLAAAIQLTNSSATGGNSWYLRAGAPGTYTPDAGFSIADNGAYRLTINSAGNVGIGTATPTAALDVNGTIKGNIPGGGSYSETTQTTTTRNQWINSTVNLTVPQTGTYMIQMNARMWGLGLSDFWWKARVYNETSGGQLCVAIGLGYSGTMSKGDGTVGMTRVAALTAGDVIRLQFAISGNDTNTVYFTGDGNGGSGISIIRISN